MTGTNRKVTPPPGRAPAQFRASLGLPRRPVDSGTFRENHIGSFLWVETVLAAVSAGLAVLTGLCPDWIDLHSGSIERNTVIAGISAPPFAALARRNWRKSLA